MQKPQLFLEDSSSGLGPLLHQRLFAAMTWPGQPSSAGSKHIAESKEASKCELEMRTTEDCLEALAERFHPQRIFFRMMVRVEFKIIQDRSQTTCVINSVG